MGIRPNGDGAAPPIAPDNPETRYSSWLTDLEDSGDIVGGVWRETDAKATSGNSGVTDLAGRVAALEAVSSTSGTGWAAHKRGNMVTLAINGITSGFTLPAGYRPAIPIYSTLIDEVSQTTIMMHIPTNGAATLYDSPPAPVYGHATFITT